MEKNMVKGYLNFHMVLFTLEIGLIIDSVERVFLYSKMVIDMKDSYKEIKKMEEENIII